MPMIELQLKNCFLQSKVNVARPVRKIVADHAHVFVDSEKAYVVF